MIKLVVDIYLDTLKGGFRGGQRGHGPPKSTEGGAKVSFGPPQVTEHFTQGENVIFGVLNL